VLDQFLRIEVGPAHLGAHASTYKGTFVSEKQNVTQKKLRVHHKEILTVCSQDNLVPEVSTHPRSSPMEL
jgi:hypothetical protein